MPGERTQHFCWPVAAAMVALMAVGICAIRAAELADPHLSGHATKQMIFAGAGVAVFLAAAFIDYRLLGVFSSAIAAGSLGLLVAVFFLPAVRGSQRWIPLVGGFMLQPSELAKLAYVIFLAWHLRYRKDHRELGGLIVTFLITLAPLVLILKEPDLGTALLLPPTLMVMLFAAGARLRHLLIIAGLGAVLIFVPVTHRVDADSFAAERELFTVSDLGPLRFYSPDESVEITRRPMPPVAYCRFSFGRGEDAVVRDLQPLSVWLIQWRGGAHQIKRIEGWLRQGDPRVRANVGMQQYISMTVLGSGGWRGKTAWKSTALGFRMLPDDHTDFIFSVIGGQWGFLGCVGTLALYLIIFVFGADIAARSKDPFGRLLAIGVMTVLAAQLFINTGMTIGLMPITGMTLPLVSYGGSSMLVNCAALGLLVNVGRRRPNTLAPEPFEYD